jgi:membrane protein DedA with SNARE-associated domain
MDMVSFLSGLSAWGLGLVRDWGYLGIFSICLVSSASIFLPVPGFAIVFAAGAILNPLFVGIAAGFGSALGELTGYVIGYGSKHLLSQKNKQWLERAEKWSEKHGFFVIVIVFALTPLPDDVMGILGGAMGYDVKKFFLASLIGKLALCLMLAYGGYLGSSWVLGLFGGV